MSGFICWASEEIEGLAVLEKYGVTSFDNTLTAFCGPSRMGEITIGCERLKGISRTYTAIRVPPGDREQRAEP